MIKITHIFDSQTKKILHFQQFMLEQFAEYDHSFLFTNVIRTQFTSVKKSDIILIYDLSTIRTVLFMLLRLRSVKRAVLVASFTNVNFIADTMKNRFIERMRKIIFKRIKSVSCTMSSDIGILANRYNKSFNYFDADLPIAIRFDLLEEKKKNFLPTSVLVCDSANPLNNTIETLQKMKKLDNFHIVALLNSEDQNNYADKVQQYITKHFKHFTIFRQELSAVQHADVLNICDIYVNNAIESLSIDTIIAFFYSKKKVFVNPKSRTMRFLIRNKCHVYSTHTIESQSEDQFAYISQKNARQNESFAMRFVHSSASCWRALFKHFS